MLSHTLGYFKSFSVLVFYGSSVRLSLLSCSTLRLSNSSYFKQEPNLNPKAMIPRLTIILNISLVSHFASLAKSLVYSHCTMPRKFGSPN